MSIYNNIIFFFARCKTTAKRTPLDDLINKIGKKNMEDHIENKDKSSDLQICLQDVALLVTCVSEFERAWVVNNFTKRTTRSGERRSLQGKRWHKLKTRHYNLIIFWMLDGKEKNKV